MYVSNWCMSAWQSDWQASEAPDQQGKQLLPTEVCKKNELGWTGDEQMIKWPKRAFKITQFNTTGHQYLSLVCTYHKIINQQRIHEPTNRWMHDHSDHTSEIKLRAGIQIAKELFLLCCQLVYHKTQHYTCSPLWHRGFRIHWIFHLNKAKWVWLEPLWSQRCWGPANLSTSHWKILQTLSQFHQNRKKNPYTYLQTQEHMEQKDSWKRTEAQHRL